MGYFYVAESFKDTSSAGDVLGIFQSNHSEFNLEFWSLEYPSVVMRAALQSRERELYPWGQFTVRSTNPIQILLSQLNPQQSASDQDTA